MRILILSQWFQPEPFFKGLPLALELRNRGHDVEVLTGFPNYPGGSVYPGYRVRPWQRESLQGVSVIRVPLFPSHDRRAWRRSLNYLSFAASTAVMGPCLIRSPDVVYIYNLITLGVAAGLLRALHRCRLVLDVQDLWPESVAGSGMIGKGESNPALRLLARWCRREYRRPDRVIVQSPGFKRNLIERGVTDERIEVIYNWCDESVSLPSTGDPRAAAELGFDGRFNVLFAGTMGIMQSLDVVVEAARRLRTSAPDVLFTMVGDGVDTERLRREAEGLPNIQFFDRRPVAEMGALYALADTLLVHLKDAPRHAITIPSKTQAYLFAGKPILCGVLGDTAELVQRAGAGVVFRPDDPDSLVEGVLSLRAMSSPDRVQLGANGRAYYDRHLCFREGVSRLEQVFENVAGLPT